jgi:sRNA-binding protein
MALKQGDPVTIGVDGHQATVLELHGDHARVRTDEGLLEEVPLTNLEPVHPTTTLDTADGTVLGE